MDKLRENSARQSSSEPADKGPEGKGDKRAWWEDISGVGWWFIISTSIFVALNLLLWFGRR